MIYLNAYRLFKEHPVTWGGDSGFWVRSRLLPLIIITTTTTFFFFFFFFLSRNYANK
jgi:hypothetical protein